MNGGRVRERERGGCPLVGTRASRYPRCPIEIRSFGCYLPSGFSNPSDHSRRHFAPTRFRTLGAPCGNQGIGDLGNSLWKLAHSSLSSYQLPGTLYYPAYPPNHIRRGEPRTSRSGWKFVLSDRLSPARDPPPLPLLSKDGVHCGKEWEEVESQGNMRLLFISRRYASMIHYARLA